MSREDIFEVEATVIEVLPNTVFRVELPNRHQVVAHVSRKLRSSSTQIVAGDKVKIEMSPYDMSKGCITLREERI